MFKYRYLGVLFVLMHKFINERIHANKCTDRLVLSNTIVSEHAVSTQQTKAQTAVTHYIILSFLLQSYNVTRSGKPTVYLCFHSLIMMLSTVLATSELTTVAPVMGEMALNFIQSVMALRS